VFLKHAHVLSKRLQDVHAATVRFYSAASAHLITLGHGYIGDMTQQNGITALSHVQCSRVIRQDDSTLLMLYKTSFATPSH
jgi:hypothetical protein